MTTAGVVEAFWAQMRANDWDAASALFAEEAVIEWPCSGERIKSPVAWAEIQARYPASGTWVFDVHRLIVDGATAVSEVTVDDGGEHTARVVAFTEVVDGRIDRHVEYWPHRV